MTVESWIHPLAAIWNAGQKVLALPTRDFTIHNVPQHFRSLLLTCRDIMEIWIQLNKYIPKAHLERPVKADETNNSAKDKARLTRTSKRAAGSPTPNSTFDESKSLMDPNLDLALDGSRASGPSQKRRRIAKDPTEAEQGNASAGGSRAGSSRARE